MKTTIRVIKKRLAIMPMIGLGLLLGATVVNAAAPIPNTFAPGTAISSAAINSNFANIEARLAALEATNSPTHSLATIAGTWAMTLNSFNISSSAPVANFVNVSRETSHGTIILNVNGSFSINITSGLDINGGLFIFKGRCQDNPTGATVACGTINSHIDYNIAVNQANLLPARAASGTSIVNGNTITLSGPTLFPLHGHISKDGQVMLLEANNPATHETFLATMIRIQ